ncbi:transposase [Streptomyces sp. NPDC102437]|uniref:transposase n=1 Tax=Streptomyces sp. NPDC102437 TaxID=3366175 RepID=UPI0037F1774B
MVQENGVPVGMKHYPAEFEADAVALYRSRPGATIKSVATDLGVNTETLRGDALVTASSSGSASARPWCRPPSGGTACSRPSLTPWLPKTGSALSR